MKRFIHLILIMACAALLGACADGGSQEEVRADLDFTIVASDQIPSELAQILEQKKESSFALTYSDGSYLYIVIGAGKQPTGGYSYAVQGLWLTDNSICIDTDLIGPSPEEQTPKVPSYPYVVVKLEYRDEPVVFM